MKVLECRKVIKVYDAFKGAQAVKALNDISFKVEDGEFLGVMGPSGSGKTTLLNILAGIDKATAGEVLIDGKNILTMKKDDMAIFRRDNIGFIFQEFNLLDSLTVKENIGFPLTLDRIKPKVIEDKVNELIEYFGLKDVENSYPYNISGGQKQRTAEARALIKEPKIILGDEPTGNLDSKASKNIMESFKKINEEKKATIVMVTHDPFAASFCKRIIFIKDGTIKLEINSNGNRKEFLDKVIEAQLVIGGQE
ncbi:putative ABC transport system ATP-binding protein [Clostridium amylolyticum]|uniref:Putative ABC transport system ATP-binding protein n=1 Tax=Clostridium amylolyticum TaxID=1121298 RepID=A0A1M6NHR2_9CLOT|nr:ABC transporter ATP-binding protein [Clostridium amylolyticum]SHJ95227.1 putative ABC transport system ATP-binding protein [Clostridium amylolyticum]